MKLKNLKPGVTVNYLTVIKFHHKDGKHRKFFLCKCRCGENKIIHGSSIVSGNTKSCGCLQIENGKKGRLPNNRGIKNHLIRQYKRHAKGRGFEFKLSYKEFNNLILEPCHYCGTPPSNTVKTKNHSGFTYNGIDRLNSSIGYQLSNCVPACKICNLMKRDMPKSEFMSHIMKIYNHIKTT